MRKRRSVRFLELRPMGVFFKKRPNGMKHCPHCRLPIRQAGAVYPASDDGVDFVFAVCSTCYSRLSRLPAETRHKALNRAADTVADDPYRYAHRAFETELDARLFAGLAGDVVTASGVVTELLG